MNKLSVLNIKWDHPTAHLSFDLSFDFNSGEPVYIQGENGVGKTSLINHLKIYQHLYWDNDEVINFVDQGEPEILEDLSPKNIVNLIVKRITRERSDDFKELRDDFKANEFWHKPFYQLSGGQKQIAKILIGNIFKANVYIFDEPFLNLDQKNKKIFKNYLERLIANQHKVLITEHNAEFIPRPFNELILKNEMGVVRICS